MLIIYKQSFSIEKCRKLVYPASYAEINQSGNEIVKRVRIRKILGTLASRANWAAKILNPFKTF